MDPVIREYSAEAARYDRRWAFYIEATTRETIARMPLHGGERVLDVGCGKGFLLYEFTRLLPRCTVRGFDVSEYGIATAKEEVRDRLFVHRAQDSFPFADREFDLVISLNTIHNLLPQEAVAALREMERVGRHKYLVVESFKDAEELFNLQCWALTCESFFRPETWAWVYGLAGYTGDYEYIYFEPPEMKQPLAA